MSKKNTEKQSVRKATIKELSKSLVLGCTPPYVASAVSGLVERVTGAKRVKKLEHMVAKQACMLDNMQTTLLKAIAKR